MRTTGRKIPSMAELASELGLSRMTVSCIVNGRLEKLKVTEATVKRVQEHLAKRGYVPSRHACRLRNSPGKVVGILYIGNIFAHLAEAINQLVKRFSVDGVGLELMVTPSHRLVDAVRELMARRITDLIWIHNSSAAEEYRSQEIAPYLANIRTVIYNYLFDSPLGQESLLEKGISLVGVNRLDYKRRLAEFLYQLGHRKVAFPGPNQENGRPFNGEIFTNAGLSIIDGPAEFNASDFVQLMKRERITAIHFHGDSLACKSICALRAQGVCIPEDLTVTGFDGTSHTYYDELTTFAMPITEMVDCVSRIIEGADRAKAHCVDMNLVKAQTHSHPRES